MTAATTTSPSLPATPALARTSFWNSARFFWGALLLLTAAGAWLRYWRLDFQAYWTDEGYTLNRIAGTYNYLLTQLTDQGFPPGWYVLLRWWRMLAQDPGGFAILHALHIVADKSDAYQPYYLRWLPAFFGTLTVPAMCLLARQFTDRRGALLVTLLTAVNPFLIYYARDIKMYAALWFFCVLHMALFLLWQKSRRHLLWLPLLAATGFCMTMCHYMSCVILAMELLFLLLCRRPRMLDVPLWMASAALGAVLTCYWALIHVRIDRVAGRMSSEANQGMSWIQDYTDMSWRTVAGLPSAQVLGFLWPVYPPDSRIDSWFSLGGEEFRRHLATRSWPWMAQWQLYCVLGLFAVMIAGLFPWRRMLGEKPATCVPEVTRGKWWWLLLWIALPTVYFALTWIPPDSPWHARIWHGLSPKPLWEPRYLGVIIPAWLLWLAASMRRLPTAVLRTAVIVVVTGVCTVSSLSNHLLYRNTPLQRTATLLEAYAPADRSAIAVAFPDTAFPFPAENSAFTVARHLTPNSIEDQLFRPESLASRAVTPAFPLDLDTPEKVRDWLRNAVSPLRRLRVLVLTDRYGDLRGTTDDILSNEAIAAILGPQWRLKEEQTYQWHYEWRFYIFHTWRTRVWINTAPSLPFVPAATASRPATRPQ